MKPRINYRDYFCNLPPKKKKLLFIYGGWRQCS
ncbi:hypothetical protein CsSME_00035340 [Camellia sinensis var. sinensis]